MLPKAAAPVTAEHDRAKVCAWGRAAVAARRHGAASGTIGSLIAALLLQAPPAKKAKLIKVRTAASKAVAEEMPAAKVKELAGAPRRASLGGLHLEGLSGR